MQDSYECTPILCAGCGFPETVGRSVEWCGGVSGGTSESETLDGYDAERFWGQLGNPVGLKVLVKDSLTY